MMKYKVFKLIYCGQSSVDGYSLKETNSFIPHDDEQAALDEITSLKNQESQDVGKTVHGYVILPFVPK